MSKFKLFIARIFNIEIYEDKSTPFTVNAKVIVYDRYRFAIPAKAKIIRFSESNDGVAVELITSNSPISHPIGSLIWVHNAQLRLDN